MTNKNIQIEYKLIIDTVNIVKNRKGRQTNTTNYILKCKDCGKKQITQNKKFIYYKCIKCGNSSLKGTSLKGGSLIINEYIDESKKCHKKQVEIQCSCGNTRIYTKTHILKSIKENKEILCRKCTNNKMSVLHRYSEEDLYKFAKRALKSYQEGAIKRKIEFNLTEGEFIVLINNNCHYCGSSPSIYNKKLFKYVSFKRNGIDRVNNNKGYITDNCVPCCKQCNLMKLDLTKDEFINHIKKVLDHIKAQLI